MYAVWLSSFAASSFSVVASILGCVSAVLIPSVCCSSIAAFKKVFKKLGVASLFFAANLALLYISSRSLATSDPRVSKSSGFKYINAYFDG